MLLVRFRAVALLLLLASCSALFAYEVGEVVDARIEEISPTQLTYGKLEVQARAKHLRGMSKKKRAEYLAKEKRIGQAIIGPGGKLYLVDGHHLTLALMEIGAETRKIKIIADYSKSPDFWADMEPHLHLRDARGEIRSRADLPATFHGLVDDPYRSLAWLVRKVLGYDETLDEFQEFFWADFFRQHEIEIENTTKGWKRATLEGIVLSKSVAARKLPGYSGSPKSCSKLLNRLRKNKKIENLIEGKWKK